MFCDANNDDRARLRSEAIFSEFKDNYFTSGWPGDPGKPGGYVRFQVSVKANLVPTRSPCTVFFTYTQKSLWDLWNFSGSSPFEDSNYNPALFLAWREEDRKASRLPRAGFSLFGVYVGVEHESNGRAGMDSRSWNRVTAFARFGYRWAGEYSAVAQPSLWFPFGYRGTGPNGFDPDGGGNPDLLQYYGYGQLVLEFSREPRDPRPRAGALVLRDWSFTGLVRPGSRLEHFFVELTARKRLDFIPCFEATPLNAFVLCSIANGETLLTYRESRTVCRIGLAVDDRAPEVAIPAFASR